MAKDINELQKENEELVKKLVASEKNLEILKKKAYEINEGLEKENDSLKGDVKLLNEEIAEIKRSGKSSKKEASAKPQTPKEKGYTTIDDIKKFADQKIKNAPKQKQSKK